MKIAFFLDNWHVPNIDFSTPELGNPGVGACEYLHVSIPYFINKYCGEAVDVVLLAVHTKNLPESLTSYKVNDVIDAANKAKEVGADYFIFRPRQDEEKNILSHIDEINMPSIGRAALTPRPNHVRKMAKTKNFRALVCVGREQYDYLVDTPLRKKLSYIDNGVHTSSCWLNVHGGVEKDKKLVSYMGALVPMKGFHQLAQAWPLVLERHPDAKLSVIGSVKMYGDSLKVGPLGIASEDYECNHIIPYLCDSKGRVHPSVTFHGQMSDGKFDILRRSIVGIANPTGQTETCCVSAVEMSACKTAVISGAYYALLDTVLHEETGLLGRGVKDLASNICEALDHPERAIDMGMCGYKRVCSQYDFVATAPKWRDLFTSLDNGDPVKPDGFYKNLRYHYKILRLANSFFQSSIGRFLFWPSVFEAQYFVSGVLSRVKAIRTSSKIS